MLLYLPSRKGRKKNLIIAYNAAVGFPGKKPKFNKKEQRWQIIHQKFIFFCYSLRFICNWMDAEKEKGLGLYDRCCFIVRFSDSIINT